MKTSIFMFYILLLKKNLRQKPYFIEVRIVQPLLYT